MKKIFLFLLIFTILINITKAQWQQCGPGYSLMHVIVEDSLLIAGSCINGIFFSTNNGDTWINSSTGLPYTAGHYGAISALLVKGINIFAASGGIYLSTNYGTNWNAVNNGLTTNNITSLASIGNNIFAGTFNSGIFISTDSGANWTAVNNGLTNTYIKSLAVCDTNIYAGTGWWNGGVFKSDNNGSNWTLLSPGLPPFDVIDLAVKDSNIFVAFHNHGIYRSSNNGTSWSQINNGLTDTNINCINVFENDIYTATNFGFMFLSTDNGTNWSSILGNLSSQNIQDFAINDTYLFAVDGVPGGLWRRMLKDSTVNVNNNLLRDDNIRIYPNPALDNITINTLSLTKDEIISIYDIQGQLLLQQPILKEKTEINIAKLTKGMYLIKLNNGDGIMIKKFIKE